MMARFAQIVDGVVTNTCEGESLESALASSFAAEWVERQAAPWVEIPPDVVANSRQRHDGGFDAPAPAPEPAPLPAPAVTVEQLSARVDSMAAVLNKIAEHLGVQTETK